MVLSNLVVRVAGGWGYGKNEDEALAMARRCAGILPDMPLRGYDRLYDRRYPLIRERALPENTRVEIGRWNEALEECMEIYLFGKRVREIYAAAAWGQDSISYKGVIKGFTSCNREIIDRRIDHFFYDILNKEGISKPIKRRFIQSARSQDKDETICALLCAVFFRD